MRYPISGSTVFSIGTACDGQTDASSGGAYLLVHGTATGSLAARGKVFWLRGLWAQSIASAVVLGLADASYGATAANVTPYKKFAMYCASYGDLQATLVGVAPPVTVSFPAPGMKFTTNCLAFLVTGSGATGGTFGGCGYEE